MKRAITGAVVAFAGALSYEAGAGDVATGDRLARQWCANCHAVDGSGPSASLPQGPPSFRVAAGHLNPEELRAFLTYPHGRMPDLSLTRSEIDDLIDYMRSLR